MRLSAHNKFSCGENIQGFPTITTDKVPPYFVVSHVNTCAVFCKNECSSFFCGEGVGALELELRASFLLDRHSSSSAPLMSVLLCCAIPHMSEKICITEGFCTLRTLIRVFASCETLLDSLELSPMALLLPFYSSDFSQYHHSCSKLSCIDCTHKVSIQGEGRVY
jgi:hypothetical protein